MTIYRKARREEANDLVDFLDFVFRLDFEALLPKVYHQGGICYEITRVAEQSGRIVAEAAVLPQTVQVGRRTLRAGFLGSVSVHPRARGQGHMKTLMKQWIQEMEQTMDFSVLSGLRQRYEYFGYTSGGCVWTYTVLPSNLRHGLREADAGGISFMPLFQYPEAAALAAEINQARNVHVFREPENMERILTCYGQSPLAVLEDGAFLGYLLVENGGGAISELALRKPAETGRVIKAYWNQVPSGKLRIQVPEYDRESHAALSAFAETYRIQPARMFRIFRFAPVLEAYLTMKWETDGLSCGTFSAVLDGQPVTVQVTETGVQVTDQALPDAPALDRQEAQQLLLTPFGRTRGLAPRDWFPLPLFWYTVDEF